MTCGQLLCFLSAAPGSRVPHDPDRVRAAVTRNRLRKGLPPARKG